MALSRVIAVGDGVARSFVVNFALGYISQSNVTARVGNEVDGAGNPVYRAITWNSPTVATLAGAIPGAGVRIIFDRTVPRNTLLVNYEDGDIINDENLNTAQKQAIMLVHEVLDGRIPQLDNDLDMGGFRITRLGAPIAGTDAATRAFVEAQLGNNNAAAAAAKESARQAEVSNQSAAQRAASAELSRQAAADRAAFADNRANAASASASNASGSATAAGNSATAAAGSATASAADRVQTGQDRTAVRADAVQTAADRVQVRADRDDVRGNSLLVSADTNQVRQDRDDVRANRNEVRLNKTATDTALTQAVEARDLARLWATQPEDIPVIEGFFSAYHWAQKAQEYAAGNVEMDQVIGLEAALAAKLANVDNVIKTNHLTDRNVTFPKLPALANGAFLARSGAGSGTIQAVPNADAKTLLAIDKVANKTEEELVASGAIATALNGKAASSHTHPVSQISDAGNSGIAIVRASTPAQVRQHLDTYPTSAYLGSKGADTLGDAHVILAFVDFTATSRSVAAMGFVQVGPSGGSIYVYPRIQFALVSTGGTFGAATEFPVRLVTSDYDTVCAYEVFQGLTIGSVYRAQVTARTNSGNIATPASHIKVINL